MLGSGDTQTLLDGKKIELCGPVGGEDANIFQFSLVPDS